ncbi:MAG: hypothetical protein LBD44_01555 [Spirochaetaceae bacterium]|nr:hypothetical protein [Spirochaetaceae bacterium]
MEYYSADLGQLRADENKQNHGPIWKRFGMTDTVKGVKNGSSTECLLTLTERKTRVEIVRKLKDGREASVTEALDAIEKEMGDDFSKAFKSITADNGVEFSDYHALERSCLSEGKRYMLFFARPFYDEQ